MVALIAVITATATENRETNVEPLAEYLYQWFICSSTRFPCPAQFLIRHQHYFSKSLVYSLYLLPPRGVLPLDLIGLTLRSSSKQSTDRLLSRTNCRGWPGDGECSRASGRLPGSGILVFALRWWFGRTQQSRGGDSGSGAPTASASSAERHLDWFLLVRRQLTLLPPLPWPHWYAAAATTAITSMSIKNSRLSRACLIAVDKWFCF